MELSDVSKVIDLTSQNAVNEHLDLGWKIISIYATTYDNLPGSNQTQHYVLGWIGANPKFPVHEGINQPW